MLNSSVWPTNDYSRVPYRFYHELQGNAKDREWARHKAHYQIYLDQ
jgi:hypothetical protein